MLENENPVLVGIASWGYGCPKGRPKGIYTNVSNYIRFVILNISKFPQYNTTNNRGQLKNPDISGALHTLRFQYKYTLTQCGGGARDVRVL